MRVLQLCKFFPPETGGMESVVRELADGLVRNGAIVSVLCANKVARTVRQELGAGYGVTRAASFGRLLSTSLAPALVGELRRAAASADLIHVHMPDPLTALALRMASPRVPLVVHWHSDVVRQHLARRLYEPLQQWLLRRADAVVATSAPYAASSPWLRRFAAKTTVIPIGIGDESSRGSATEVEAIRSRFGGRRIVFSLGRMAAYKGFDVLIDAAALLPEHCVVVVGGEGALLEMHRRRVAERGLEEKIVFVGAISHDELPAWFKAARVFCLPSVRRSEAYGVVLAEAMAMGVPVVATEIEGSGVTWVNRSGCTGINVPVRDNHALAGALRQIVEDDALAARFGKAARRHYVERLTSAAMLDAVERLYQRLLAPATARSALPS